LRTMGASTARSEPVIIMMRELGYRIALTLTLHTVSVDTDAADQDIVDDREAAFAPYPITLTVLEATV
jgi:hypothetical protein